MTARIIGAEWSLPYGNERIEDFAAKGVKYAG